MDGRLECPFPDGHLQATGRDAKGRKQYRYHTRFREVRESTKYEHVVAFADILPAYEPPRIAA
jgi:DNA topoisomerase I